MADEEEHVFVSIVVVPKEGLPQKEWEVEIDPMQTVGDLKLALQAEYSMPADCVRLCQNNNKADPGMASKSHVADLPSDPDHADVKKVYMLPVKGKEQEMLDAVLNWANLAGFLDEYEAKGAKYTPQVEVKAAKPRPSLSNVLKGGMAKITSGEGKGARRKSVGQPQEEVQINSAGEIQISEFVSPMVLSMPFNLGFAIVASLNMLVVGLEADYTCWGLDPCTPADRGSWYIVDILFALLFEVEVIIRIVQLGPAEYFLGDPISNHICCNCSLHFLNVADFLVIQLRFLDTLVFDQVGLDTKLKIISCFRIMQFARVAKLMRLVKSVRELWIIIAGCVDLFKTVVWVMLLLVIIMWVMGIIFVILIGHDTAFFDYSSSHWGQKEYFGTVPKAAFSLFQMMTLSNWSSQLVRPVFEQYPWIFVLVVPFLCIATVGLLNIIVGVVVESTLNSAANNAEKEGKENVKMQAKVLDSLKMVFEEADTDGGGSLDRDELHRSMKKPHVRDRLKVLDIPIKDLDQLFFVMDEEQTGEIDTERFFRGCSRLRGPALACDLHRMSVDFRRYIDWTDTLAGTQKELNSRLASLLRDMESVDRDIIKGDSDEWDPVLGSRRDRSAKKEKMTRSQIFEEEKLRSGSKASGRTGSKRKSLLQSVTTTFA